MVIRPVLLMAGATTAVVRATGSSCAFVFAIVVVRPLAALSRAFLSGTSFLASAVARGVLTWVVNPIGWLAAAAVKPLLAASRVGSVAIADVYLTVTWASRRLVVIPATAVVSFRRAITLLVQAVLVGIGTLPDTWTALQLLVGRKEGNHSMESLNLSRQRLLSLVGTLWLFGIFGLVVFSVAVPSSEPTVEVVQWANSHMTRSGLLPDMAKQFNDEGHTTQDGKKIVVKVYSRDSYVQVDDLRARVTRGVPIDSSFPDPTIVTPSADHWLIAGNYAAGRTLVDLNQTRSLAHTWIGIVTDREMAECLGWPQKEIGYADIIALAG